jgi:hypothetical protein
MPTRQRDRIRMLNDQLRRHHRGGMIVVSSGIQALGAATVRAIDDAVSSFDDFDPGNDPYGEHDFGAVTVAGHVAFFKIDYFDLDRRHLSPDPADPDVTCRVMALMLAREY